MSEANEQRRKGIAMMREVYGWDVGENVSGEFVETTVDHLFGEVWANGTMSVRERRLLLLGLLLGSGQSDVVGLQIDCATNIGELSIDELRELVMLVAHYAGWPVAARFNQQVEALAAKKARAESE